MRSVFWCALAAAASDEPGSAGHEPHVGVGRPQNAICFLERQPRKTWLARFEPIDARVPNCLAFGEPLCNFEQGHRTSQIADANFHDPANSLFLYQAVKFTIAFGPREMGELCIAKPIGGGHEWSPCGGEASNGRVARNVRWVDGDVRDRRSSSSGGRVLLLIGYLRAKNVRKMRSRVHAVLRISFYSLFPAPRSLLFRPRKPAARRDDCIGT